MSKIVMVANVSQHQILSDLLANVRLWHGTAQRVQREAAEAAQALTAGYLPMERQSAAALEMKQHEGMVRALARTARIAGIDEGVIAEVIEGGARDGRVWLEVVTSA